MNQSQLAEWEVDTAAGSTSPAGDSVTVQEFSWGCEMLEWLGHWHDPTLVNFGKCTEPRVKTEFTNVTLVLLHLLEITSQSGGSGTLAGIWMIMGGDF